MLLNVDFHSHRTQLILTALGASVATASILSAYQQHTRARKRRELDAEIRRSLAQSKPEPDAKGKQKEIPPFDTPVEQDIVLGVDLNSSNTNDSELGYDEELVREQLARNYAFFGDEGMSQIRKGTVVVVGCGGVGSWAAVMLVRSYVRRLDALHFR